MAQVFRCLQDNRDTLKDLCRSALFEQVQGRGQGLGERRPVMTNCLMKKRGTERDAVIRIPNVTVERDGWARQEVRMSEDVNFDYPLKKSCTNEITTLCKDVPPGRGLRCSAPKAYLCWQQKGWDAFHEKRREGWSSGRQVG